MTLFSRLYAAGYDWWVARLDRRGGEEHRRRLVEDADGDVIEIGAGTGMNFPHYRKAARVVALEPDPGMRARAERRAGADPYRWRSSTATGCTCRLPTAPSTP
jgi:hypothetical protein